MEGRTFPFSALQMLKYPDLLLHLLKTNVINISDTLEREEGGKRARYVLEYIIQASYNLENVQVTQNDNETPEQARIRRCSELKKELVDFAFSPTQIKILEKIGQENSKAIQQFIKLSLTFGNIYAFEKLVKLFPQHLKQDFLENYINGIYTTAFLSAQRQPNDQRNFQPTIEFLANKDSIEAIIRSIKDETQRNNAINSLITQTCDEFNDDTFGGYTARGNFTQEIIKILLTNNAKLTPETLQLLDQTLDNARLKQDLAKFLSKETLSTLPIDEQTKQNLISSFKKTHPRYTNQEQETYINTFISKYLEKRPSGQIGLIKAAGQSYSISGIVGILTSIKEHYQTKEAEAEAADISKETGPSHLGRTLSKIPSSEKTKTGEDPAETLIEDLVRKNADLINKLTEEQKNALETAPLIAKRRVRPRPLEESTTNPLHIIREIISTTANAEEEDILEIESITAEAEEAKKAIRAKNNETTSYPGIDDCKETQTPEEKEAQERKNNTLRTLADSNDRMYESGEREVIEGIPKGNKLCTGEQTPATDAGNTNNSKTSTRISPETKKNLKKWADKEESKDPLYQNTTHTRMCLITPEMFQRFKKEEKAFSYLNSPEIKYWTQSIEDAHAKEKELTCNSKTN